MKKSVKASISIFKLASLLWLASTAPPVLSDQLSPFSSDGCSLFPDGWPTQPNLWLHCCVQHDIAYWQGGTEQQRQTADLKLKVCVETTTKDPILAENMYLGVRFGGHPIFPNWYRWGYGWPYSRQYKKLTESEQDQVKKLLEDWQSHQ